MPLCEVSESVRLHYEVVGSGSERILFIMGMLTEGAIWTTQTDYFKSKYECCFFDNAGVGKSSSSPFNLTTYMMAQHSLALVNHLKWEKFHLVGISMGGMIAIEMVLEMIKRDEADRILNLSLLCTTTNANGLTGYYPIKGILLTVKALMTRTLEARIEIVLKLLYSQKTLSNSHRYQQLIEKHRKSSENRQLPSLRSALTHIRSVNTHHVSAPRLLALRYSNIPVLIVAATDDVLVSHVNSERMHQVLNCDYHVMHDAGHGINSEYADELHWVLEKHFQNHENVRKGMPLNIKQHYAKELSIVGLACQHNGSCWQHCTVAAIKLWIATRIVFKIIFILYHLSNQKIPSTFVKHHNTAFMIPTIL